MEIKKYSVRAGNKTNSKPIKPLFDRIYVKSLIVEFYFLENNTDLLL